MNGIALSPDGSHLVTTSRDGTVRSWDLATGQERWSKDVGGDLGGVAFSPEGNRVAFATGPTKARKGDWATYREGESIEKTIRVEKVAGGRVTLRETRASEDLGWFEVRVECAMDSLAVSLGFSAWGDVYLYRSAIEDGTVVVKGVEYPCKRVSYESSNRWWPFEHERTDWVICYDLPVDGLVRYERRVECPSDPIRECHVIEELDDFGRE